MVAGWLERLRAQPVARDVVIATAWLLLGLVFLQAGVFPLWGDLAVLSPSGGPFFVTLIAMIGLATLRSRWPLTALCLGTIVAGVDLAFGGSPGVVLVLTDLIYAAVKYGSDQRVRNLLWTAVAAATLGAAVIVLWPASTTVTFAAIQWGLIIMVSGAWGWNVRSERERTRKTLAAQHSVATRELRHRTAHDLHDLVANQIAVAGLHVEAAKLVASTPSADPAALLRSLDQAKRGTDQAHRELRDLIAVLTAVDALEAPVVIELDEELDQLATLLPAGRSIDWGEDGRGHVRTVLDKQPVSNRRVALRVLQELVANAAKHGVGDLRVRVTKGEQDDGAVRVTLSNECAPLGRAVPGSGLGLGGAKLLLGGIGAGLTTQPGAPDAPWRTTVTIPTAASSTAGRQE